MYLQDFARFWQKYWETLPIYILIVGINGKRFGISFCGSSVPAMATDGQFIRMGRSSPTIMAYIYNRLTTSNIETDEKSRNDASLAGLCRAHPKSFSHTLSKHYLHRNKMESFWTNLSSKFYRSNVR